MNSIPSELKLSARFRRLIFAIVVFFVSTPLFALTGGNNANQQQSIGIVGISYSANSFKNCIGVVLQPNRVLTTASCLDDFSSTIVPEDMRVHPLIGSELGGSFIVPVLDETITPFTNVESFVLHPLNDSPFGPYNLAVLRLAENLTIPSASIYGGNRSFVGSPAVAFGWDTFTRSNGFLNESFYRASVLALPAIIDGDDDVNSIENGCYDNFEDTDTVFCAGYRDGARFLESEDEGAPLLATVDGASVVIGMLNGASNGLEFQGQFSYEEFARITPMLDFIIAEAPNTKLVMDSVVEPPVSEPIVLPAINLLLLDN